MRYRVEYIVRKGEIACNKQFLLFSQCFPQLYTLESQNVALCGNGLITKSHKNDRLIAWYLMSYSTLCHYTYPYFPGVLFPSTQHNVPFKPLAAFPHNHSRTMERSETGINPVAMTIIKNNGRPGSWLVVSGFNAALTAKVIHVSWRSVTHMCSWLSHTSTNTTFLSKATDYFSHMLLQR